MHNYSPCQKRRRCETRKCSGNLRNLYFCGVHITATSGIAVHHAAPPPQNALLLECIFHVVSESHRMTPTENRDVIDFVLEGVSFPRQSFREGPYPGVEQSCSTQIFAQFP